MQNIQHIGNDLIYVGASDRRLALFENVYPIPRGVSYNSYVMLDDKNVLFDTGFNEMLELRMEDLERLMNSRRGEAFRQQLSGTAYGGNQGTALQQRDSVGRTNFRLKEMKALKTKLYDIDAHAEETTDSKLGAAILNHGAVIINARKRKIYFLPAE